MLDSYCGKSCEACEAKEQLNCSGISGIIYIVTICKIGKYNHCFKEIFILWLINIALNLSRNWERLGKRFCHFTAIFIIGMIVSLLLIIFIPLLGIASVIFFVIMAIVCIVLMIEKFIYTKKTADLFKRYYQHYKSL